MSENKNVDEDGIPVPAPATAPPTEEENNNDSNTIDPVEKSLATPQYAIDTLFQLHFSSLTSPKSSKEAPDSSEKSSTAKPSSSQSSQSSPPLLALGMLQWGTTPLDHHLINSSRGVLTETEARDIYNVFRSRGVVLFDTAEGYGGGTSEKRLGRLCRRERLEMKEAGKKKEDKINYGDDENDGATVATDVTDNTDGLADVADTNDTGATTQNLLFMTKFLPAPWRYTHAHFENALRASNKRMGITKCPIYLLHSPMHLWRDVEYWVESADICRRKGLMEALGLSNCSSEEVRRVVEVGRQYGVPVILNQVHYSLLDYNSPALKEMQSTCQELGVSIIAYNSLGQGLLTDNLTKEKFACNKPSKMMRIEWDDLVPLRCALRRIADVHSNSRGNTEKKVSMAQVALNWCRAHNAIPLVGCRSVYHAADSLASLDWELEPKEVAELDSLALSRCTLDSPRWRRKLFVALAGVVMTVCRWMDLFGFGVVKQASIGM